ncbi:AAA family ATPase [Microcoleus sp. FACHB-68]|uniref:WD40 domain-containing protein n=1 Tax=Microcoleus sp. FACHB-68 TaxID=2692826 RepID=UPI001F55120D|nr:AAA family ATPase [Microcoleus sp. FACHB-68]
MQLALAAAKHLTMTDPHPLEYTDAYNERSVKILARAITLSAGQFTLIFVRCNYAVLQERMANRLREFLSSEEYRLTNASQMPVINVPELVLPEFVTTLYTTIRDLLADQTPQALMVFGLESVTEIERVLASTNQVREEFRKNFPFPLVLWVNDVLLQKLVRLAADFKSWAATSIKFEIACEELIHILRQPAEAEFTRILQAGSSMQMPAERSPDRLELELAQRDLLARGVRVEPAVDAGVQFVLGLDSYANDDFNLALGYFKQSLGFWQQGRWRHIQQSRRAQQHFLLIQYFIERQGVVLFHIGLCYCRKAEREPAESRQHWNKARRYLQQCLDVFERGNRPDLISKFINHLGEVLRRLEAWDQLHKLAQKALILHYTDDRRVQLAQDYGFLAEVCVEKAEEALQLSKVSEGQIDAKKATQQVREANKQARDAKWAAQQALDILASASVNQQQDQGLYLFLLARALRLEAATQRLPLSRQMVHVNGERIAITYLEQARVALAHRRDPQLYIRIMEELRSLYFKQGQYLNAFLIKKQQREIEHQYGLRAFIGAGQLQPQRQGINPALDDTALSLRVVAPELAVAARRQDIERLIERMGRNDYKLTVIYGTSGVGKSSLVNAGLVPALQQRAIGDRVALPVVLRVYTDWMVALGRELAKALQQTTPEETSAISDAFPLSPPFNSKDAILEQLRQNADRNRLTVLIFDQFEEFFFVDQLPINRRPFFEFLRDCLNIPFVKVILSLREDYLHYLLEYEGFNDLNLDAIDNNILDKEIRYPIKNFSETEAKNVLKSLTEGSQFYLEEALIDALVNNLLSERETVRPIELQVVGAQLQEDKITTLEQYRSLDDDNPKAKLVQRSLKQVIGDCGPENEEAAWTVLFSLTDAEGRRPLKTKHDLAAALTFKANKLNLILEILVGSGLVFHHREEPADHYQLVHDYLVDFIHQEYKSREQLQQREQLKRSETQKLLFAAAGGLFLLLAFFTCGFWLRAEALKQKAEILKQEAEIAETKANLKAHVNNSEYLFNTHQEFDALIESLWARKTLESVAQPQPDNRIRVVTALQQAVYGVRERNRLEGHRDSIWSVSFSPDGQLLASGGNDHTVKLWSRDGRQISVFSGHSDSVTRVSFSPDGQLVASASRDKTVKIWKLDGTLVTTLNGHADRVYSVNFSPDGQRVVTGSHDQTVKLWKPDGTLIATLAGHSGPVEWVCFSPDGQLIASASDDKTVKLWKLDGTKVKTLTGHSDWVMAVSFSPQGNTLATAGRDTTVKLWKPDGTLLNTLIGHKKAVYSLSFSLDGKLIATASDDQTVKLWQMDGTLLKTLEGHSGRVTGVSFSPDGELIATGSLDKTVKLWATYDTKPATLKGHSDRVTSVSFSPDGGLIATGSRDKTVKLWLRNTIGQLQNAPYKTLTGHNDRIINVTFSPDGQMIASASLDNTVKLWNREGQLVKTLSGRDAFYSVSFSPNGQLLATGSKDHTVKLWTRRGELLKIFSGHGERVNSVRFSPDGRLIASASDDKTVKLWNLQGKLLRTLGGEHGHRSYVTTVSFSPNGQLIATGSWDNTVKLWPLDGSPPKTLLKGYSDSVTSVAFSPDGQTVASAGWDSRVKLWSLDGTLLKALKEQNSGILEISFSPDGKVLASAHDDKTVILWNLDLNDLVRRACGLLHDYLQTSANVTESERLLCDSKS